MSENEAHCDWAADSLLEGFIIHFHSALIGFGWHLICRTLHMNAQTEWKSIGRGCVGGGFWKAQGWQHSVSVWLMSLTLSAISLGFLPSPEGSRSTAGTHLQNECSHAADPSANCATGCTAWSGQKSNSTAFMSVGRFSGLSNWQNNYKCVLFPKSAPITTLHKK